MISPQNFNEKSRIVKFRLSTILAIALIVRIIHLLFVKGSDLVNIPIIDSAYYHLMALDISRGDVIGDGIFFMSPLYPYLMGLLYAVFGPSELWIMIFQVVLSVSTVYQLYKFANKIVDRQAAEITALMAALYAPFIFYDSTLLTASLIMFLSSLILNYSHDSLSSDSIGNFWKLGFTIGLSALARPLVLIFFPFLIFAHFQSGRTDWKKRSLTIILATFILLIPLGIRNLIVGDEFVMTSSSGGMNFYVGNNEDATGLYWEAPFLSSYDPWNEEEEYRRHASELVEMQLSNREASRYWLKNSMNWIINNPSDYALLLIKKSFYFFNRAEFANNVSYYYGKKVSPILRFNPMGFWLICPLGLAGLILLWKHKGWKHSKLLWLWLLAYYAGALAIFNASEYRLPVVLVLLIGAAYTITSITGRFRRAQLEPALRIIALLLLFLPIVNFRTTFTRSGENARMDYFNYGNTLLKLDRADESIERFQSALAIDSYFAEGLHRLADAYYRTGQEDKAVKIGERIGLDDPASIIKIIQNEAKFEGYALMQEGKLIKALSEFIAGGMTTEEAEAETTRIGQLNRAKDYFQMGDKEAAIETFKTIRGNDSQIDPSISYNIAMLHFQIGDIDSAEIYATEVMKNDSMNIHGGYLLARIYGATNREDEGKQLIHKVNPEASRDTGLLEEVRIKMDELTLERKWLDALNEYARYGKLGYEIEPEDKLRIGRLQLELGNNDQALELLQPLLDNFSSSANLIYLIGRTNLALGQIELGVEYIQKSIFIDPDFVPARITSARHYLRLGERESAMREIDAVSHLKILDSKLNKQYLALRDSIDQ